MKRVKIIAAAILLSLSIAPIYADTAITGAFGYFTMPITSTPAKGAIHINAGYIFNPGNLYVSLNTAVIQKWEISAGKEILAGQDQEFGATPFIIGTKYMFYEKGSFRAAAGLQFEAAGEAAGLDGMPVSIYGAVSEQAGKLGYMNMGLGYTFSIDAGYRINLFVGVRKELVKDKLFAVGEITNFSVRSGLRLPWDEARGICNAGLVLELTDFIKFKMAAYDLLDDTITVGFGGEFRIKAF